MNIVQLMMGGVGNRFGAEIPKQFIEVDGRPIFSYIAEAYNDLDCVDAIVVVVHKDWIETVEEWKNKLSLNKIVKITQGGETRSDSVKNGLEASGEFAADDDVVLMCDATHPYVDKIGTAKVIDAVKEFGGATLAQFQYDTVYGIDPDTQLIKEVVPRQEIVSGASPEGFRFGDINRIYQNATREELDKMTSAGAIALAYGIPMKAIKADIINLKITYPNDMDLFIGMKEIFFPSK